MQTVAGEKISLHAVLYLYEKEPLEKSSTVMNRSKRFFNFHKNKF